jgi:hypothetical protein
MYLDPSPEVDAAWQALGVDCETLHRRTLKGANIHPDRPVRVDESEAPKSGLGPSHVRIQQRYGGGYPANVEGLHHLHCLVRTQRMGSNSIF